MMTKRVVIRVSRETHKQLQSFAKESKQLVGDVADALIATGIKRRAAVNKWASAKASATKDATANRATTGARVAPLEET